LAGTVKVLLPGEVYSTRQAPLAVSLIVTPVSLPTIAEQAPAVIVTPLTEIVATFDVT
jgi:hypothetical protein